ncbi:hypothetical protein SCARD494_03997 [Seiridium cardinale]
MSTQSTENVRRKPLPQDSSPAPAIDISDIYDDYFDDQDVETELTEKTVELKLEQRPPLPARLNTIPLIANSSEPSAITRTETTIPDVPSASKSFWKTAVDETIYFAGGLISRPVESTKHFSILRHSSALVYYKGPSTRVTITIFSDAPLPPERSLWLQRKGFSGNLGMNVSTLLGTSSNWIDVTPSIEAIPSDVPEADERAWQRDIKKFLKRETKHVACETCIIRIPAAASDGYLRLVLCTGESRKKVLCPSPVFRIASTSSDVSIFRGASLSTMPLEAGLKVASVVGTTVVNKYIGPAKAVVDNRVQKYTSKMKPGFIAERAEHIPYAKSGLQNKFEALERNFDGARHVSYDPLHDVVLSDAPPEIVGADSGPQKPFPLKFSGTVVQGTGRSQDQMGLPTANLSGVPGDFLLRLNGVYIGWARLEPDKSNEGISHDWHEAIITIGPAPYVSPGVVAKNVATVHIIHAFNGAAFFGTKLKTIIMAYLHPAQQSVRMRELTQSFDAAARDTEVALASLSRETWGVYQTVERMKTEKSARSVVDKYVEARTQFQKGVDSIPLHLAGFRTASAEVMDKAHGRGGIYIRR